jgi:hypothetical protein
MYCPLAPKWGKQIHPIVGRASDAKLTDEFGGKRLSFFC